MTRIEMRPSLAMIAAATISVIFVSDSDAAVSNAVRSACEKEANAVTPPLRAGEREAYITNCIADAAAKPGKVKKKKAY